MSNNEKLKNPRHLFFLIIYFLEKKENPEYENPGSRIFISSRLENKNIFIDRFNKLLNYMYNVNNVDYYTEKYNINKTITQFDHVNKYLYHKNGSIVYIKLRLMDIDQWPNILTHIFNVNIDSIITENLTTEKSHKDIYNFIKSNYVLSIHFFDILKTNSYLNLYFTDEEKEKYLLSVKEKITNNQVFFFTNDQLIFYFSLINENETIELYRNKIVIDNGQKNYINIKHKKNLNLVQKKYNKNKSSNKIFMHLG